MRLGAPFEQAGNVASVSCEDVALLHVQKAVKRGKKCMRRRFAARPPLPRPSVRRTFSSFLSPLFFAALQQKRHSRSSLPRSVFGRGRCRHTAEQWERGAEGERERGSQAAYQRNFLGVIDRPLPPLLPSPAVRLPSLARSLFLLPSFPSLLARPLAPKPRTLRENERFLSEYRQGKFQGNILPWKNICVVFMRCLILFLSILSAP